MVLTFKINTVGITVGGAVYGAAEVAVGGAGFVAIDNAVRVAVSHAADAVYDAVEKVIFKKLLAIGSMV